MVPLAIFIGLVPVSIAGFGTRDAALVTLLPNLPASLVLAVSLYINLRYILPAVAGIPFLARYATARRELQYRLPK
jgi:glycosyltransferase 2 family protein